MGRFRRFVAAVLRSRTAGFEGLWAAAFLLPAIALAVAALDTQRVVNAEVRARITRTADMLHEQAASTLEAQEGLLSATVRRISGLDWAAIARSAEVHRFIRDIDERVPGTAALGLVAPDGHLVAASRRPVGVPPVDVSHRDYVVAHREGDRTFVSGGGTYVTSVFVTEPNKLTVVGLSRPTLDAEGRPDGGVVTAIFVPQRFGDFYARTVENTRDSVALLRRDGAVLARYPAPAAPVDARLAPDHPLVRAMKGEAHGGLVEASAAQDGVDRLYAWRQVGSYPVVVAYGIDRAVIGADIRKRLVAPGAVAVLGMAVLLLTTARAERASARLLAAERARTETEARLRQLERVGAFGELAAGVAHDFRNAAQVMESCARLLHRGADNPVRVREHADMVAHAATLIATLTNRMLDIARRRPAGQEAGGFDPYEAVVALSELLNRTLGGGCRVTPRLAATTPRMVMADRSEFESALVNLVVNARDAMPEGGEVVLWVGGLPPGAEMPASVSPPFVAVAVIDHGQGMDADTLAHAGEPFFTTKQSGQGTGLGVAGARGFAERVGGLLTLHSRPGNGTVATLWLPVQRGEEPVPEGALSPSPGMA